MLALEDFFWWPNLPIQDHKTEWYVRLFLQLAWQGLAFFASSLLPILYQRRDPKRSVTTEVSLAEIQNLEKGILAEESRFLVKKSTSWSPRRCLTVRIRTVQFQVEFGKQMGLWSKIRFCWSTKKRAQVSRPSLTNLQVDKWRKKIRFFVKKTHI